MDKKKLNDQISDSLAMHLPIVDTDSIVTPALNNAEKPSAIIIGASQVKDHPSSQGPSIDTTTAKHLPWPIPTRQLFPKLPKALKFLAQIDCCLDASELVKISTRIVESGLWQNYRVVCQDFRDYRLVFENDYVDIWVLSWMPGQETGFHDHDISSVGICVADGVIEEQHMHVYRPDTCHLLFPGQTQEGPVGYIHRVLHSEGKPAVSVHSYCPPLAWVGQYREKGGYMVRLREPGRTRLTPN
jgi:hypothetical protein